jgi:broad specificity phosphatase PhoE
MARHGETTANAAGILDTRLPGHPLSERGHRQAAELAEKLVSEPVVAVYASRALRAQQTAAPVAAQHGLDVQVLPGVHEVSIGELEGGARPEDHRALHEVYHAWHAGDLDVALPGGESGRQVLDRYLADVAKIRATHQEGTVVLVSHGAASRLAVVALASNVDGAFAGPRLLPNAAYVLLEADPLPGADPVSGAGAPPGADPPPGAGAPSGADSGGWRCLRWDDIELG